MNGKTARLCRKLARTFPRTNKTTTPEAFAKTWKRRWRKLASPRRRARARTTWAHDRGVRLPA